MPKIACILVLSVITVLAQHSADTPSVTNDREEFLRYEKVWNEAHVHGDADVLDALWAQELVVTVPKMPVMDKKQSLRIWQSGRMKFQRYETSDINIKVFGDAAVVTGRLLRVRRMDSREFKENWRFTKVYIRRDGPWRVVAWHASEAARK